MRKQAREYVFKLIFEYIFLKEKNTCIIEDAMPQNLTPSDNDYIDKIYNGVIQNFDTLFNDVSRLSQDFRAERVYKVDLAVLLLAMYEISYMNDVPYAVAVNEAVELVKTYSTDKSYSFINGILASYIKEKDTVNGKNN